VVEAFLDAARGGDLGRLLALLAPDAVVAADPTVVSFGAEPLVTGVDAVARTFAGRAEAARAMLVDGTVQAVWTVRGVPKVVFAFTLDGAGRVSRIDLLADPDRLAALAVSPLPRAT
jgi:RNA polymerase sigma-70 factor (ECF subfamily)